MVSLLFPVSCFYDPHPEYSHALHHQEQEQQQLVVVSLILGL
jgi:hypothetical protein